MNRVDVTIDIAKFIKECATKNLTSNHVVI